MSVPTAKWQIAAIAHSRLRHPMAVPCPVPSRQVRFRDCYGMNTGFTAVA